ncbi:uncharacterized protein BO80DRAFT_167129 [Aspergillus ibericus CBS 121593]|uniref:Uncharacterized protein n=1 Tax=Aspergillus ibericus CBS 121593 TaxID=1448316 RepID=A0A395GRX7_9EURO|nr:hypothetical protein BO80DRAFT_167129 [Aspergillus ibericus CBS 121593]RAK98166.1 hypothetical protein BO80DRAFT_167129 [Aspergillus ibericus CBS 121593]
MLLFTFPLPSSPNPVSDSNSSGISWHRPLLELPATFVTVTRPIPSLEFRQSKRQRSSTAPACCLAHRPWKGSSRKAGCLLLQRIDYKSTTDLHWMKKIQCLHVTIAAYSRVSSADVLTWLLVADAVAPPLSNSGNCVQKDMQLLYILLIS